MLAITSPRGRAVVPFLGAIRALKSAVPEQALAVFDHAHVSSGFGLDVASGSA
jgi:hypothetical protein